MAENPPATVLLVDDDPLIRTLGQELLQCLGFQVLTAGTGPEALDLYQSLDGVDLVILDYHLPGVDGSQVLEGLKTRDEGVRVLMASGFFTSQEAARLKKLGARGLIQKPFRVTELESRIRAVLAGKPVF